ncbi:MAG: 50S ribosomal protein L25 [Firmicutes bacterium HGW-Firmicutes-15]|nr:MAG: 50S ribosomal protein L25 [Firmicutes bacterium HGW-Firmicutes-15]
MALTQVLKCKKREIKTTGYLNQLKRDELVPAVIYGKGKENLTIVLANKELSRVFTHIGTRGIFSLEIEGEKQVVMAQVKEIQKNRISGVITHVDFLTVKMDEKINSMIRIHLVGEEEIIKKGGALQLIVREIPVSCLPGDLIEVVNLDISGMEIGSKVLLGDLALPATVEALEDADTVVANILASSVEEPEVKEEKPAQPSA